MKKHIGLVSGCVAAMCILFALAAPGARAADYDKVTLSLGDVGPANPDNLLYQYSEKFKALVEERSGGRITINHHSNAELGGERDMIEGVTLGTVDMTFVASSSVGNFVKEAQIFDFPFLFRDFDHVEAVMRTDIAKGLAETIEKTAGVKFMSWGVNGFRYLCNSLRPVRHPDDMKGLKLRTIENQIHMEFFTALGASPTPMSAGELYTALQQKTVDGMDGPLAWIVPAKFWEVQKYISETRHLYAPSVCLMDLNRFNGLSKDTRELLLRCAEEAADYQLNWCREIDATLFGEVQKLGMEMTNAKDLDLDAFRARSQVVYDRHPEYKEIAEKIMAVK